jgi:predicted RNase H-like HicB family nuclease
VDVAVLALQAGNESEVEQVTPIGKGSSLFLISGTGADYNVIRQEEADDHYTYGVAWSDEDKEYVGLCAEFPSLSWLAGTREEALQGIRSVVAVGSCPRCKGAGYLKCSTCKGQGVIA